MIRTCTMLAFLTMSMMNNGSDQSRRLYYEPYFYPEERKAIRKWNKILMKSYYGLVKLERDRHANTIPKQSSTDQSPLVEK